MSDTIALVAEYHQLRDQADAIASRLAQITTELRGLGVGKHAAGEATISIGEPTRRFDLEQAMTVLDPTLQAACMETLITARRAKDVLPPALYQQCCLPQGETRVTIR